MQPSRNQCTNRTNDPNSVMNLDIRNSLLGLFTYFAPDISGLEGTLESIFSTMCKNVKMNEKVSCVLSLGMLHSYHVTFKCLELDRVPNLIEP